MMNKRQLSKYYYLSLEIKDLENKIRVLRETTVGSPKLTGMPISHNNESPLEKRIELILELTEKLEDRKLKAIEEMIKIENFIMTIDDIETRRIFNKRYIELKKWEKIAKEMHMGIATAYRIHRNYLKKVENDWKTFKIYKIVKKI